MGELRKPKEPKKLIRELRDGDVFVSKIHRFFEENSVIFGENRKFFI
jgi:hypothetical protein